MTDSEIIEEIKSFGIDYDRLRTAMTSNEPWGKLTHSFEFVTVLGVVEDAMRKDAETAE